MQASADRFVTASRLAEVSPTPPPIAENPADPRSDTDQLQPADLGSAHPHERHRILAAFLATRVVGNAFIRFPYVFSTAIAAGLDIRLAALTTLLGIRELFGIGTPLLGRLADAGHLTRLIWIGSIVAGLACILAPETGPVGFALLFATGGLAKLGIDVAQNSWISHQFDGARRGQVVGVLESSWALAFIVVVPILGVGIQHWGWRAAFWICGPLLILAGTTAGGLLGRHEDRLLLQESAAHAVQRSEQRALEEASAAAELPTVASTNDPSSAATIGEAEAGRASPARRRAIYSFVLLQPFAQMLVFAVIGDWFVKSLALSTPKIGVITFSLGLAELVGTLAVVAVAKRLNPLIGGAVAMAACALLFGLMALDTTNAVLGVGLLLVADVALEFGFVSVLPAVADLNGASRGKSFGNAFAVVSGSRAMASVSAGALYVVGGFSLTAVVAALLCLLGAAMLWAGR